MPSKSFASLRLRLIHAKKRSTTQRRGKTWKPIWLAIFVTTSMAMQVASLTRWVGIGAVDEGEFDEGEGLSRRPCSSGMAPSRSWTSAGCGLDHQRAPIGVDHGVALSPLDLLAGVIASGTAGFRSS